MNHVIKWDFFIAHAGPDIENSQLLFKHLSKRSRVFLDSFCLKLGDNWDIELPKAQKNSEITVVLISDKTENAYYQREEIAAVIALSRNENVSHRVVPIYLKKDIGMSESIPYGLRLKHGITITNSFTLSDAADRLLELLDGIRYKDASAFLYGNYISQLTSPNLTNSDRQQIIRSIEELPGLPKQWSASVSDQIYPADLFEIMERVSPLKDTTERKAIWLGLAERTLINIIKNDALSEYYQQSYEQFEKALKDLQAPENFVSGILEQIKTGINNGELDSIESNIVPKIYSWLRQRS